MRKQRRIAKRVNKLSQIVIKDASVDFHLNAMLFEDNIIFLNSCSSLHEMITSECFVLYGFRVLFVSLFCVQCVLMNLKTKLLEN